MTDSSETMPLVFSAPGRDLDPPRYGHELCEGDGRLAEAHGQRLEPGDAFRGLLLRYSLAHGGVGSDAQERSLECGRAGRGLGSLSVGVFRDGPDGDASGRSIASGHPLPSHLGAHAEPDRRLGNPGLPSGTPPLAFPAGRKHWDEGQKERSGKDSEVYKRAEVSKQLFSKILNNPDYQPTKSTVLQLALGLQLDLPQTQKLLEKAGYALTRSSKTDLVVKYYIERKIYNVTFINEALYDCGLPLLKTGLKT